MGLSFWEHKGELTKADSGKWGGWEDQRSYRVEGGVCSRQQVHGAEMELSVIKDPIWLEVKLSPGAWLPGAGRKQEIHFI